ncbi:MAG TPA: Ldh family oxidoreductase [Gemmataceae bacterium]|nr:Ldh family oxidoreductase [Gemmataceae bacterium]
MPTTRPDTLLDFARRLFLAAGVSQDESQVVARSLVDANLCGHDSHGVIRVPQYVGFLREGKLTAGAELTVLRDSPAMLAADANWGLGQVQAYRALARLREKAAAVGIAGGTLRRCGHIGRLGEYAEWAAERGLALFATVNSHGSGQRVAPPGGLQGRISTNPICFGAPTPSSPLVLDFSTSACAEGKVRVALQKGAAVPNGWILNAAGDPTTVPGDLYTDPPGSMLPFGGAQAYKGFGLGLLMDALAGGLSGGDCTRADRPMLGRGNCVVFVLWDVDAFGGREHFRSEVGGLTDYVRQTPRRPDAAEITLPGDPERCVREKRAVEGIPIADGTWSLLARLAAELRVEVPKVV